MELRDYQLDLYQKTRLSFRAGNKDVLVVAPCGAGKTYLFSEMVKNTKGEALVLVHRQELKDQHEKLFRELGITNARVETYQTERNHLEEHEAPRLLVVDEAHLSRSNSWAHIIAYYNTFTVGVTATPVRLDGKPLGDIFGDMVQGITTKELIERKCLAPYDYYAPTSVDTDNLRIQAGDFLLKDLDRIMRDKAIYSDVLNSWRSIAEGAKTIAYGHLMENFGERRTVSIPWWTLSEDGKKSKMPRNCTIDFKVEMISQHIRWKVLGYRKGQRLKDHDKKAHEMHMGFSLEEARRCNESPNPMFINKFPLVQMGWTRADSYAYCLDVWGLDTKASACSFCPFHQNYYFRYLKENHPDEYAAVVEVDNLLRDKNPKPPMDSDLFISRSRKRLEDLTPEDCDDMKCFEYCGRQIWNGF